MTLGKVRGAWVPAAVAARRLGVHVRTVRRWIASSVLAGQRVPVYRDGRCRWFVHRGALDAWCPEKPPRTAQDAP